MVRIVREATKRATTTRAKKPSARVIKQNIVRDIQAIMDNFKLDFGYVSELKEQKYYVDSKRKPKITVGVSGIEYKMPTTKKITFAKYTDIATIEGSVGQIAIVLKDGTVYYIKFESKMEKLAKLATTRNLAGYTVTVFMKKGKGIGTVKKSSKDMLISIDSEKLETVISAVKGKYRLKFDEKDIVNVYKDVINGDILIELGKRFVKIHK